MRQPAAKEGDKIVAVDMHIVMITVPPDPDPVPTPLPHPFNGIIDGSLSNNVRIMGMPAATEGSTATNTPVHIPEGDGPFQKPPTNRGTIVVVSSTVMINGKLAARNGDKALTCDDLNELPKGTVLAEGSVLIG